MRKDGEERHRNQHKHLAIGMMVELGIAEPKSEDELRRSIMSVIK